MTTNLPKENVPQRISPHGLVVGDKAKVVEDSRIVIGKPFSLDFTVHLGKVGTVTHVGPELIALKFSDGKCVSYWHKEVTPVLATTTKESNAQGTK